MDIYLYLLLVFFSTLTYFHVLFGNLNYKVPPTSFWLIVLLGLIIVVKFTFSPIIIYGDKFNYKFTFEELNEFNLFTAKDIGFRFYSYFIKSIIDNSSVYFFITAFIYVISYIVFAKKYVAKPYILYFLLACFTSMGFDSYGVNTIRAGFALSLFILALSFQKNKGYFIFFSILSLYCHKSMILPILSFVITGYYNKPKLFIYIWILTLIISISNISFIINFITAFFADSDNRFSDYLTYDLKKNYKTGFRIDFLIYSLIPILIGCYYLFKLKINDYFYSRIFNTYLLSNSLWLLVIRMAFTDRVAYLSWFLIPFLLLYPLLKFNLAINQRKWISFILLGILSFTSYIYFK